MKDPRNFFEESDNKEEKAKLVRFLFFFQFVFPLKPGKKVAPAPTINLPCIDKQTPTTFSIFPYINIIRNCHHKIVIARISGTGDLNKIIKKTEFNCKLGELEV